MDKQQQIPNNIYLLGMPGSGKSTLGEELSQKLSIDFYDLDRVIEFDQAKSIDQIFNEQGEQGFRLAEQKCLRALSELPEQKVIATGGGTPCFHQNMEYLNSKGVSIFLDVPVEILVQRLQIQGTEERPLLKDKSPQELLGRLQEHFLQRKSHYLKAYLHLEGPAITSDQIVSELSSI